MTRPTPREQRGVVRLGDPLIGGKSEVLQRCGGHTKGVRLTSGETMTDPEVTNASLLGRNRGSELGRIPKHQVGRPVLARCRITGSNAPEFSRQKMSPMTTVTTSSCLMVATCAQIGATSSAGGDAPIRKGYFRSFTVGASPGGPTTSTSWPRRRLSLGVGAVAGASGRRGPVHG